MILSPLRIQVPEFLKIVTTKISDIRVIRAKNIFPVLAHNRSFPLETQNLKLLSPVLFSPNSQPSTGFFNIIRLSLFYSPIGAVCVMKEKIPNPIQFGRRTLKKIGWFHDFARESHFLLTESRGCHQKGYESTYYQKQPFPHKHDSTPFLFFSQSR